MVGHINSSNLIPIVTDTERNTIEVLKEVNATAVKSNKALSLHRSFQRSREETLNLIRKLEALLSGGPKTNTRIIDGYCHNLRQLREFLSARSSLFLLRKCDKFLRDLERKIVKSTTEHLEELQKVPIHVDIPFDHRKTLEDKSFQSTKHQKDSSEDSVENIRRISFSPTNDDSPLIDKYEQPPVDYNRSFNAGWSNGFTCNLMQSLKNNNSLLDDQHSRESMRYVYDEYLGKSMIYENHALDPDTKDHTSIFKSKRMKQIIDMTKVNMDQVTSDKGSSSDRSVQNMDEESNPFPIKILPADAISNILANEVSIKNILESAQQKALPKEHDQEEEWERRFHEKFYEKPIGKPFVTSQYARLSDSLLPLMQRAPSHANQSILCNKFPNVKNPTSNHLLGPSNSASSNYGRNLKAELQKKIQQIIPIGNNQVIRGSLKQLKSDFKKTISPLDKAIIEPSNTRSPTRSNSGAVEKVDASVLNNQMKMSCENLSFIDQRKRETKDAKSFSRHHINEDGTTAVRCASSSKSRNLKAKSRNIAVVTGLKPTLKSIRRRRSSSDTNDDIGRSSVSSEEAVEKVKDAKEFLSPLSDMYQNGPIKKTGLGYGQQKLNSYKIPKINSNKSNRIASEVVRTNASRTTVFHASKKDGISDKSNHYQDNESDLSFKKCKFDNTGDNIEESDPLASGKCAGSMAPSAVSSLANHAVLLEMLMDDQSSQVDSKIYESPHITISGGDEELDTIRADIPCVNDGSLISENKADLLEIKVDLSVAGTIKSSENDQLVNEESMNVLKLEPQQSNKENLEPSNNAQEISKYNKLLVRLKSYPSLETKLEHTTAESDCWIDKLLQSLDYDNWKIVSEVWKSVQNECGISSKATNESSEIRKEIKKDTTQGKNEDSFHPLRKTNMTDAGIETEELGSAISEHSKNKKGKRESRELAGLHKDIQMWEETKKNNIMTAIPGIRSCRIPGYSSIKEAPVSKIDIRSHPECNTTDEESFNEINQCLKRVSRTSRKRGRPKSKVNLIGRKSRKIFGKILFETDTEDSSCEREREHASVISRKPCPKSVKERLYGTESVLPVKEVTNVSVLLPKLPLHMIRKSGSQREKLDQQPNEPAFISNTLEITLNDFKEKNNERSIEKEKYVVERAVRKKLKRKKRSKESLPRKLKMKKISSSNLKCNLDKPINDASLDTAINRNLTAASNNKWKVDEPNDKIVLNKTSENKKENLTKEETGRGPEQSLNTTCIALDLDLNDTGNIDEPKVGKSILSSQNVNLEVNYGLKDTNDSHAVKETIISSKTRVHVEENIRLKKESAIYHSTDEVLPLKNVNRVASKCKVTADLEENKAFSKTVYVDLETDISEVEFTDTSCENVGSKNVETTEDSTCFEVLPIMHMGMEVAVQTNSSREAFCGEIGAENDTKTAASLPPETITRTLELPDGSGLKSKPTCVVAPVPHKCQIVSKNGTSTSPGEVPSETQVLLAMEKRNNPSQPRVRVRRLSGDRLSKIPDKKTNNELTSNRPVTLEQSAVDDNKNVGIFISQIPIVRSQQAINNIQQQVIEKPFIDGCATDILKEEKLMNLFRCSGFPDCSYSFSFEIDFCNHLLEFHRANKKGRKVHPKFLKCVYCERRNFPTPENLAQHIHNTHKLCQYQCPYCPYRACRPVYILWHLESKHASDHKQILVPHLRDNEIEVLRNSEHELLDEVVLPFICAMSCNYSTMSLKQFMDHSKQIHSQICTWSCYKCTRDNVFFSLDQLINHFFVIHSMAQYQCVYCLYGSKTIEELKHHLMQHHSFLLPKAIERRDEPLTDVLSADRISDFVSWYNTLDVAHSICTPYFKIVSTNHMSTITLHADESRIKAVETVPMPIQNDFYCVKIPASVTLRTQWTNEIALAEETERAVNAIVPSECDISQSRPLPVIHEAIALDNSDNEDTRIDEKDNPNDASLDRMQPIVEQYGITLNRPKLGGSGKVVLGLSGKQLYKCGMKDCTIATNDFSSFHEHLKTCDNARHSIYVKCPHCGSAYKTSKRFLIHIDSHGIERILCTLCEFRATTFKKVSDHMRNDHKVQQMLREEPLYPYKKDKHADYFHVVPEDKCINSPTKYSRLSSGTSISNTSSLENGSTTSNVIEDSSKKVTIVQSYQEATKLCKEVTSENVMCGICGAYSTKVRNNIIGHMKTHDCGLVANKDIVNPVPRIERPDSELMFNKMANHAAYSVKNDEKKLSGSHDSPETNDAGSSQKKLPIPQYVPKVTRFKCAAINCNYYAPDAAMLKKHADRLHSRLQALTCPHCGIKYPTAKMNLHLRYHSDKLFKCNVCDYIHYQKVGVEKHQGEKHEDAECRVVTVRELLLKERENIENLIHPVYKNRTEKFACAQGLANNSWKCCLCRTAMTSTEEAIRKHCTNVHRVNYKIKCGLCDFGHRLEEEVDIHLKDNHGNASQTRISVYREIPTQKWPIHEKIFSNDQQRVFSTTDVGQGSQTCQQGTDPAALMSTWETNVEISSKTLGNNNMLVDPYPNGAYRCPFCSTFKCHDVEQMREHIFAEKNYIRFVCIVCGRDSVSRSILEQHIKEKQDSHPPGKNYIRRMTQVDDFEQQVQQALDYQFVKNIRSASNARPVDTTESIIIHDSSSDGEDSVISITSRRSSVDSNNYFSTMDKVTHSAVAVDSLSAIDCVAASNDIIVEEYVSCLSCPGKIVRLQDRDKHDREMHTLLACLHCDKILNGEFALENHIKRAYALNTECVPLLKRVVLICPFCGFKEPGNSFENYQLVSNHVMTHLGKNSSIIASTILVQIDDLNPRPIMGYEITYLKMLYENKNTSKSVPTSVGKTRRSVAVKSTARASKSLHGAPPSKVLRLD